jgi:hypothetical protein
MVKIWYWQQCVGSIPVLGTISSPFFKTRHHGGFFGFIGARSQPLNFSLSCITKSIELFSKAGGL